MTERNPYKTGDFEDTSMSLQLAINHNLELQKRICELETELAAAREAVHLFASYGCPICGGDCAAANPPVAMCPMQAAARIDALVKGAKDE